jgi:hypothetical protein
LPRHVILNGELEGQTPWLNAFGIVGTETHLFAHQSPLRPHLRNPPQILHQTQNRHLQLLG